MKFGPIAVADAAGAILAHTTRAGDRVLKKGRVLSEGDAAALAAAGIREVVGARLDPGELDENAAAGAVAVLDRAAIATANEIDEAITVATVAPYAAVRAGDMVATVKIIPFA